MLEYVTHAIKMNADYAKANLADIPADQWCRPCEGQRIHPASIVGHIVTNYGMVRGLLGGEPSLPAEWCELFSGCTAATADPSAYPSKEELLAALEDQRSRMTAMLSEASAEDLAQPTPHEEARKFIPTVGAMLVAILTIHEALHLGQLSAWRRAMGMELPI